MIIDLVMCSYTKTYDNWSRYVQLHKGTSQHSPAILVQSESKSVMGCGAGLQHEATDALAACLSIYKMHAW